MLTVLRDTSELIDEMSQEGIGLPVTIDLLIIRHRDANRFTPGIEVNDCISEYRVYGKPINAESEQRAILSVYNYSLDMAMVFMIGYKRRPVILNLLPISEDKLYSN